MSARRPNTAAVWPTHRARARKRRRGQGIGAWLDAQASVQQNNAWNRQTKETS